MATHKTEILPNQIKQPIENADSEFDRKPDVEDFPKSKVECICPGCGKLHIMKMHWIGRGVPRKFCESCRDREAPLDEDF